MAMTKTVADALVIGDMVNDGNDDYKVLMAFVESDGTQKSLCYRMEDGLTGVFPNSALTAGGK